MKFETRPVEVEAIQWEGNPDSLTALLNWIMADRVSEPEKPRILYNIWWGGDFDEGPRTEATISGARWSVDVKPGDWVIKDGAKIKTMPDEKFRATYKEKRSRR